MKAGTNDTQREVFTQKRRGEKMFVVTDVTDIPVLYIFNIPVTQLGLSSPCISLYPTSIYTKTVLIPYPSWLPLHFLRLYSHRLSSFSFLTSVFSPPFRPFLWPLPQQAVMQSSDSCAQSQGLELARQPSRGVTTPPRSVGKQQERKEGRWGDERKGGTKPMWEGGKQSESLWELPVSDSKKCCDWS